MPLTPLPQGGCPHCIPMQGARPSPRLLGCSSPCVSPAAARGAVTLGIFAYQCQQEPCCMVRVPRAYCLNPAKLQLSHCVQCLSCPINVTPCPCLSSACRAANGPSGALCPAAAWQVPIAVPPALLSTCTPAFLAPPSSPLPSSPLPSSPGALGGWWSGAQEPGVEAAGTDVGLGACMTGPPSTSALAPASSINKIRLFYPTK